MPDSRFSTPTFARDAKLDAPAGFDHTARVLDYWSALRRAQGTIPARTALDPRSIDPSLSHVFIAELVTPRVARLRIAGNHLHDLMGMDVRGMPIQTSRRPRNKDVDDWNMAWAVFVGRGDWEDPQHSHLAVGYEEVRWQ